MNYEPSPILEDEITARQAIEDTNSYSDLTSRLLDLYRSYPQVEAIGLAGSLASGASTDRASDIDLCVYITSPIPLEARLAVVEQAGGASRASMDLDFWGPGDEWFDARTGIEVDVVYWDILWMEEMLDSVLNRHQPALGYTTAFWHTIRSTRILFDRTGWLGRIRQECDRPYPEPLRQAIITRNLAVLDEVIPAYLNQVEKAARRGDLVSVNHRVAALLASYFDILFAYNRVLHPGEKRLVEHAKRLCQRLPDHMAEQVNTVLRAAGQEGDQVVVEARRLVEGVEELVRSEK
jgi:hypothetical protein